jgi:hypothetical protein
MTISDTTKSTSHFGKTVYHDINTGKTYTVPWGGADWLLFVFLVALGSAVIAFLSAVAVGVSRVVN